ncbi:hypothetical protein [Clostridium beijerinckii]|jgi:hypothetical protein|nr:hypothetical protein [Clostridium beijerinckii]NRT66522.1 hypothetical protein [Clostridium beijerinckii]NRU51330.1 hypothetical protein [Clostridium beijerinckii]NRZ30527.1 hypothetical protein [Clostridium beijerinckii]NSA15102.1 hypothetical protein [Clostridium beijerinckii]NSA59564.1 hypothetical protein [Clostridium beijerinckii]
MKKVGKDGFSRRIKIVRHPKLQVTKTPFLDKDYFDKRKIKLHIFVAA